MNALKLIGVLLDYPRDEWWQHRAELLAATARTGLPEGGQRGLAGFVEMLLGTDVLSAQDAWLSTFDRGRSMSLLLFEHIHGESRDRGQAMVDLIETYRRNGFELAAKELPDYLPLVLEYLAHRPIEEVRDWLSHISHIVGLLAARSLERQSPYAVLFELLLAQADGKVDIEVLRRSASQEARDDTPDAMDRLWEEESVRFGAEAPAEYCSPNGARHVQPDASRTVHP